MLLAVVAAFTGCSDFAPTSPLQPPDSPLRAVDINETTPVAFAVTNPCNGEPVVLTGTQHLIFRTTQTKNGVSYGFSMSQNMTGVGAFGTMYNAQFTYTDRGHIGTPYPVILSFSNSTNIISTAAAAGNRQDFHSTFSFQLTVNANGTATVDRTSSAERCNGQPVTGPAA